MKIKKNEKLMRKSFLFLVDVVFCLKILTLHGGGGSGASMESAISSIRNALGPDITYVHATTPESNGLWFQDPPNGKDQPTTDPNWANNAIVYLDNLVLNNGPFDGIMGYSQGSAMTILYTSMYPESFRFVVTFCGYLPETHLGLMNIITGSVLDIPSLFYMSTLDNIISNQQTERAREVFLNSNRIIDVDVGGHIPPYSGSSLESVVQFINSFKSPMSSPSSLISPPPLPPMSFNSSPSLPYLSNPNNESISLYSVITCVTGVILVMISFILYYYSQ